MTAQIIDGNAIAREVRAEWKLRADRLNAAGCPAGLAVIMVGDNAASRVYVANKLRASEEMGIRSERYLYPADTAESVVLERILALNADPSIHGILVQLPLPPQVSVRKVLETISPDKDVDGFHLYNVGGLVAGGTVFPPCTPYGVVKRGPGAVPGSSVPSQKWMLNGRSGSASASASRRGAVRSRAMPTRSR